MYILISRRIDMNEKMVKAKKDSANENEMVFQYRDKIITPEMDGPDVVATIYEAKPRPRYDGGVVLPR